MFATVETVRSQVPSWPDFSRPAPGPGPGPGPAAPDGSGPLPVPAVTVLPFPVLRSCTIHDSLRKTAAGGPCAPHPCFAGPGGRTLGVLLRTPAAARHDAAAVPRVPEFLMRGPVPPAAQDRLAGTPDFVTD